MTVFEPGLLLTIAYVALAFVLLVMCLKTTWPWLAKVVLVIAVTGFYFTAWSGVRHVMGWATAEPLPERFVIVAGQVQEPNKEKGSAGTILLWVMALGEREVAREPRAYRIAYDKETHGSLNEAMRKTKNGVVQMGKVERPPVSGSGWLMAQSAQPLRLRISDMPLPALPEK